MMLRLELLGKLIMKNIVLSFVLFLILTSCIDTSYVNLEENKFVSSKVVKNNHPFNDSLQELNLYPIKLTHYYVLVFIDNLSNNKSNELENNISNNLLRVFLSGATDEEVLNIVDKYSSLKKEYKFDKTIMKSFNVFNEIKQDFKDIDWNRDILLLEEKVIKSTSSINKDIVLSKLHYKFLYLDNKGNNKEFAFTSEDSLNLKNIIDFLGLNSAPNIDSTQRYLLDSLIDSDNDVE